MKFFETFKKMFTEDSESKRENVPVQAPEELEVASAAEKIARTLKLIEANDVCANIAALLNSCDHEFATNSVKFRKTSGDKVLARDYGQKDWFKVDALWTFEFGDKRIELVTVNLNAWGSEFGDTSKTGTLVVRANQDVVFETYGCGKQRGAYGIGWTYNLHASAQGLESFKNGDWMAELKFLVGEKKNYDLEMKKRSEQRKRDEIRDKAGKIDLG